MGLSPFATWPISTMQTRRRSALGCFSAEITEAITNGLSRLALSSTRSTSSPIMVSLSTISLSGATVSRCSLSQGKVNFTGLIPRQRREIERPETVLREPARVGLEEGAQVVHAVFQHGDAVDAHAPGKALVLIGIEPAIAQHVRMHHAAAENFQPILAFAETNFALVALALDVDFHRRLGEGKERWTKAHLDAVDFEEGLAEFFQDPFQMAEMRALVDDETLDLVEHRRVCLIAIASICAAGNNDADRRLLGEHGAHLHRRRVRAQQQPRSVRFRIEIELSLIHISEPTRQAEISYAVFCLKKKKKQ